MDDDESRGWSAYSQEADKTREHVAGTDETEPVEHDGRADTRTGFDPREFEDTEAWMRRNRHQDGEWENDYQSRANAADRRRLVSIFAGQLGLGKPAKARARHIADEADGSDFGTRTEEVLALGIVSYVAREVGWADPESSDIFVDLLEDCETGREELRSVRKRLRETTDL